MEMESTSLGLLSLTFHHILLSSLLFKRSMEPSSSFRTLKVFTLKSFPLFVASIGMERIVRPSGIGFVAFKTTPEGSSLASGFYLRSFEEETSMAQEFCCLKSLRGMKNVFRLSTFYYATVLHDTK